MGSNIALGVLHRLVLLLALDGFLASSCFAPAMLVLPRLLLSTTENLKVPW